MRHHQLASQTGFDGSAYTHPPPPGSPGLEHWGVVPTAHQTVILTLILKYLRVPDVKPPACTAPLHQVLLYSSVLDGDSLSTMYSNVADTTVCLTVCMCSWCVHACV